MKYIVKFECCERTWYGKYEKFIPPGICSTCDRIPKRTIYDLRKRKLERIVYGNG